jgi:protein-L-isoaspartate(D-aspartate) O-methyltransferase
MDPNDPQLSLVRAARASGVRDARVLAALERVPRELFVPAHERARVGRDQPLRIGHGQTTSQPSLVARIREDLDLRPGARVLEVGTGFGYEAALAAVLVAPGGMVVTIERDADLAAEARQRLARLDERLGRGGVDVRVLHADGSLGHLELAPFDAIIVAATARTVPHALTAQLADGGRMIIPLEDGALERLVRIERHGDTITATRSLGEVRYVPLRPGTTTATAKRPVSNATR